MAGPEACIKDMIMKDIEGVISRFSPNVIDNPLGVLMSRMYQTFVV